MDYRCTEYCPEISDIKDNKRKLERKIKEAHTKAENMYSYISNNRKKYKTCFIEVYKGKCAYCGISIDLISKREFEIDHFKCKSLECFKKEEDPNTIDNLILSCRDCNRNKSSFQIDEEYYKILYPDGENIKNIFVRDLKYYIKINDEYKNDDYINRYYRKLELDSELHRLDYLLMNIIGMKNRYQANEKIYNNLSKIEQYLRKKRNIM